MTNEEFRKALKALPFKPFRVRMASGRLLEVRHPDFAACPPGTRIATIYDTKGKAFDLVDLLLVESIEIIKPDGTNGRRKKAG